MSAIGLEPRSRGMHLAFLVLGIAWLIAISMWLAGATWAWGAMPGFAVFALWYLPFGTLLGLAQIALLIAFRAQTGAAVAGG